MSVSQLGMKMVNLQAGDTLFKEGEVGDNAFMLLKGEIEISRQIEGKKKIIARLGEGQIIGEMAIIGGEPRMADAVALEQTNLIVINEESLKKALSKNLSIVKTLIDQLIYRLKDMHAKESDHSYLRKRVTMLELSILNIKKCGDKWAQTKVEKNAENLALEGAINIAYRTLKNNSLPFS